MFDPKSKETPLLRLSACVTLIGMAGVGKTTVGRLLSRSLDWGLLDTDRLLESYFGGPLQLLFDSFGREDFLKAEEKVVANLMGSKLVIATGGSVIYGPRAVERLRGLGPVVYLRASMETVLERINGLDQRGLAIAPGQTLESLYQEREPLYAQAADLILDTDGQTPEEGTAAILEWMQELSEI